MRGRIKALETETAVAIPDDAPARVSFALQPRGVRPARDMPDCARCKARTTCKLTNMANYAAGDWVHPFARPECEAAINGETPDLAELLRGGPRTLAELIALTGMAYSTVLSKLAELRPAGVNVVAYTARLEVVYGYGPPAPPRVPVAQRIIATLRAAGPLTAGQLSSELDAALTLVRTRLSQLVAAGRVRECGRVFVQGGGRTKGGNWAALWECVPEAEEEIA